MSKTAEKTGSCLCGKTKIHAKAVSAEVGACHCGMCRTWTGGPLLAVDCGTDVTIEGKENVSVFNSSDWAERAFCKQCGTHLYYRLKPNNQHIVPAGLFADQADFVFDHQIFVDEQPAFYAFANETKNMTGAEVFAQFEAPSE